VVESWTPGGSFPVSVRTRHRVRLFWRIIGVINQNIYPVLLRPAQRMAVRHSGTSRQSVQRVALRSDSCPSDGAVPTCSTDRPVDGTWPGAYSDSGV